MIDKLLLLLQKPALWQRSAEPFWDDEHISKGMLEAHLNPNWDAASRKHRFIDASVKWLSSIISVNGKIIDLGCGPGLYTKRLSDLGFDVTGMDYSKRSIEYAKSQDSQTEYIYRNYLELDYTGVFDAVILIYCDYAALTFDERQTLLPRVYNALKPGGLFIFDVNTEKHFIKRKLRRPSWQLCNDGGYWSVEPYLCLETTHLYENDTVAVDQYVVMANNSLKRYLNWETQYTVPKLTDEVVPFGFKVKNVFDDVSGRPYTGDGEELCFVLERSAE